MPHQRHLCGQFKFIQGNKSSNVECCDQVTRGFFAGPPAVKQSRGLRTGLAECVL